MGVKMVTKRNKGEIKVCGKEKEGKRWDIIMNGPLLFIVADVGHRKARG